MIPVAIDPAAMPVAVAGRGQLAVRRFHVLRTAGAAGTVLFTDQPDEALRDAAGEALRPRLPVPGDMTELRALWIAGLPGDRGAALAAQARSARVLVNVEDQPALCDFHSVAEIRRGDLLLTVSTGGASPGLAGRIRARLEAEFGPEWVGRVAQLRDLRATWRRDRRSPTEVAALTDALLQSNGWLA